jgi:hypothetical protein
MDGLCQHVPIEITRSGDGVDKLRPPRTARRWSPGVETEEHPSRLYGIAPIASGVRAEHALTLWWSRQKMDRAR